MTDLEAYTISAMEALFWERNQQGEKQIARFCDPILLNSFLGITLSRMNPSTKTNVRLFSSGSFSSTLFKCYSLSSMPSSFISRSNRWNGIMGFFSEAKNLFIRSTCLEAYLR